ncbi:MAG: DegT/DnrJ/EryC1/StrS family aminotransferase [Desulfobacteraceae bacterium]|nr:DegT/DnrJ/EryC1/StrS family aminotransferase [Desulfobacteraceae bacterium]
MIQLTVPSIEEDDLEAVRKVLTSRFLVQGSHVAAFERSVADYLGSEYAIAVSNGTAALHLSLNALDVRPGDMVLVTAYSWISTANVIELCGAQPVFIDVCTDTFNMDPAQLKIVLGRLMTNKEIAQRVKAILPVHTFGQLADMTEIMKLAKHYQLPVIEDAACALGATLNGRYAGTWAAMGCFSFHPRKIITTGEGGVITTNDCDLALKLRALRNHGLDSDKSSPDFVMPGYNYRMTEFQAALGITQMSKLDRIIEARRSLAVHYCELLDESTVNAPFVAPGSQPVYQSYPVLLPEESSAFRTEIIARLKAQGIESTIGTWHMPMTTYFRTRYSYKIGDFPAAEWVFQHSLTLPLYDGLKKSEQSIVVQQLVAILEEMGIRA